MAPPKTAEALVQRDGQLHKETIEVPVPRPNQVLVKVASVAQNPTDVQSLDNKAFDDGVVLGCDFVGTVEELGRDVTRLQIGQVVAGLIWGGETKGIGGYSHYTVADEKICFPVPKNTGNNEAATVPLASCTALLAFFSDRCLNIPKESDGKPTVLVWGGSSSVGLYAIQIAKWYGLDVITTCSPSKFDVVKSLGAREAFNYRDADVVDKIKASAPGLKYVFDTIGNETSSVTASKAIDESGGGLCTVRPGKAFTENVTRQTSVTDVLVWTAFLHDHQYKDSFYPASEKDHTLAAQFCEQLPELLMKGKIKPNNTRVIQGGLEGVSEGFQVYRDGGISNFKIVYEL